MTTTHCYVPILGKRLRVTELNSCGVLPAAAKELVTDGFISVSMSAQIEAGAEIIQKNAAGALCVNEKISDSFKRFTLEIEFCGVNPSLLALLTNAETYNDYNSDKAGITIAEGTILKWFALELWTGLSGEVCAPGVDEASGYLLLPFIQAGTLGDLKVDGQNAVTFSMKGAYTKGGNSWGKGPYHVVYNGAGVASYLPTALDPDDHLLLMDTGLVVPTAGCTPWTAPATTTTTTTVSATTTTSTTI